MKTKTRNTMHCVSTVLAASVLLVLVGLRAMHAEQPIGRLDYLPVDLDPLRTHKLLSGVVRLATPADAPPVPMMQRAPLPTSVPLEGPMTTARPPTSSRSMPAIPQSAGRSAAARPRLLPSVDTDARPTPIPAASAAPNRLPQPFPTPLLRPTPDQPALTPRSGVNNGSISSSGGGTREGAPSDWRGSRRQYGESPEKDHRDRFALLPNVLPLELATVTPSWVESDEMAEPRRKVGGTPRLSGEDAEGEFFTWAPGVERGTWGVQPMRAVVPAPQPQFGALPAFELAVLSPHPVLPRSQWTARGGWWTVQTSGNPFKVVQYEGQNSSYFLDVDRLFTDGDRTLTFFASGLDNDTTLADVHYFTPRFTTDVMFQRFIHRLDHDPLTNMSSSASSDEIVSEDFNIGQDYAIRVQELRTYFKGRFNDKVKYRLNLWLLRKKGQRQALATQHCATAGPAGPTCHTTSKSQRIDWLTGELEPVIEARVGPVSLAYSRPMRLFSQDDQIVKAQFGDNHVYKFGGILPYAVVPDSFTQTDRLRAGVDLTRYTHLYAQAYHGKTDDKLRDTHRKSYGFDVRLTNRRWRHLTLNSYARGNRQLNDMPPFFVDPEGRSQIVRSSIVPPYGLRHPIDYLRLSTGGDFSWRPFQVSDLGRGLALNGGAEYGTLSRSYAVWLSQNPPRVFDQGKTQYFTYFAGAKMKWRPSFDTFVRYRGRATSDPLYAVDQYDGFTNTSLPEQEDLVTLGGNWIPLPNLVTSLSLGIENRSHHSAIADFEEDNYPLTATAWYAPTDRWSLSGGYSYLTNWIDQSIAFPSDTPGTSVYDQTVWNYGGRAQLISFGASHIWSDTVTLSGGLEFVWTNNSISPVAAWPDLGNNFAVGVNKTRYTAGLDWQPTERVAAYFRYIFQDYTDVTSPYISGRSNMILAGLSAFY